MCSWLPRNTCPLEHMQVLKHCHSTTRVMSASRTTPAPGRRFTSLAGMERLPQEVVDKIAGYFPDRHEGKRIRPALATLSRSWQHAVEPYTFKSLDITSDDLEDFYQAFSGQKTRRRLLRDLSLDIVLLRYSDEDCAKYETAEERAVNNGVFSQHVSALLEELSRWPAGGGKLNLGIGMYSPMDGVHRGSIKFDRDQHEVTLGSRQDIFGERYRYSYIRFDAASPFLVPCVTSLYVHPGPRFLGTGSLVTLTAAFPNLERINWPYEDPVYFLDLRHQQMQEFTSAVARFQTPSTCKKLYINISSPWYPHKERLPDLTSNSSFCDAVRVMLGRSEIQSLHYEGPIDPMLFWPQGSSNTDHTSSWSSLRSVEVRFGLGSLEGQWFFKGVPGDRFYDPSSDIPLPQDAAGLLPPGYYNTKAEDDEAIALAKSMQMPEDEEGFTVEGCEFRCLPRDEAILPLLTAVARRLAHTPSLRNVYLEATLPLDKGVWFFSYQAPGEISDWDECVNCDGTGYDNPSSLARVFLHAEDWRPQEGVLAELRWIGKACHGEDAIVTFLPFLC